jgi:aminopeptidase N
MSQAPSREPVYLKDYRPPAFATREVELTFELDPKATVVTSRQAIERNPKAAGDGPDELVLFGENQELLGLELDGTPLGPDRYRQESDRIVIAGLPDRCELAVRSRHSPAANKSLMGLYVSNGIFCTQCEPEGFRRITYFQDRPDVMARFRVRIEADRTAYPRLLSNGNLIETGELPGGRHFARWEDPFPKPAYLFALVAGDLAVLEDSFTTRSGRVVQLRVYSEAACIDQCQHAMDSSRSHEMGRGSATGWSTTSTCSRSSASPTSTSAPWRTRASTSSTRRRCWRSARPRPTPTSPTSSG